MAVELTIKREGLRAGTFAHPVYLVNRNIQALEESYSFLGDGGCS